MTAGINLLAALLSRVYHSVCSLSGLGIFQILVIIFLCSTLQFPLPFFDVGSHHPSSKNCLEIMLHFCVICIALQKKKKKGVLKNNNNKVILKKKEGTGVRHKKKKQHNNLHIYYEILVSISIWSIRPDHSSYCSSPRE